MKIQSKFTRYKIFFFRNAKAFFKAFYISQVYGRFIGPKVFLNSIPKSGTNLLDNILFEMPLLRFSRNRTLRSFTHSKSKILRIFNRINNGQYLIGHLEYDLAFEASLNNNGFKHILVIRDPRSIIVSHFNYVSYIDSNHKTFDFFNKLNNDEERINVLINGYPDVCLSIDTLISNYSKWFASKNVLVVKFEDLIGSNGGGSLIRQKESIIKIFDFLNISYNESILDSVCNKAFNAQSPTFRSGKIDGWKSIFNEKQSSILKSKIGDWLIEHGYENDFNW